MVRFEDGTSAYEGRVEVYKADDDNWGTICDDSWDERAARVVCRQHGYEDVKRVRITHLGATYSLFQ